MDILFWLTIAGFIVLAWRRLDWATALILFSLPAYLWRTDLLGLPLTMLEVMILAAAAVWLIKNKNWLTLMKKTADKQRYPFDWEMIAWLIIALAAAGVVGFNQSALGIFKAYFFEPILLFLLVFNVLGFKKNWIAWILTPLLCSGLVAAAPAIYQFLVEMSWQNPIFGTATDPRASGWYGYPNALGLYLSPLIVLVGFWSCYQWVEGKKLLAALLLAAAAVFVLAVWAARSEGALIGVAVGGLAGLWFKQVKLKWWLALVVVAAIGALLIAPSGRDWLQEKVTLSDLSGEIRKQQWRETWQMLLADGRWLSGAGLANYQKAIAPWHQEGIFYNFNDDPDFHRKTVFNAEYRQAHWQPVEVYLYPHNIVLNFWVELGLLGALLFLWIVGKYLTIAGKLAKLATVEGWLAAGLMAAIIAILVHGLVDVPYFKNDLAALFWLLVALLGLLTVGRNLKTSKLNN